MKGKLQEFLYLCFNCSLHSTSWDPNLLKSISTFSIHSSGLLKPLTLGPEGAGIQSRVSCFHNSSMSLPCPKVYPPQEQYKKSPGRCYSEFLPKLLTGRFSLTASTGCWKGHANWCFHSVLSTTLSRYCSWLVCLLGLLGLDVSGGGGLVLAALACWGWA